MTSKNKAKGLKEINNVSPKGLKKLKNINKEDYNVFIQKDIENKTYTLPLSKLTGILSQEAGTSYIPPYLKTGGASWSGAGLVYDVTTLEYYFNGDKTASATQVTLDASDPTYNRLDAIVVDEEGVISVIKGDASASPISPSVDESHILIQYILVEAGSTQPTIAKEDIYLENVEWTTSTYTTGAATGSIDFNNPVSPKQGVKCISANADARLGARFVKATSFDPYQYTMLSMWVRFTGSNVATNKSMNVRFENGAGALVANTINLFSFGLQRNLLNVWQLVVIPITSFGALPTSVKGLKIIMTGGTVGQARQWDIDLIALTDNSVPSINEQAFNVLKDGALVGQSSSLNFKGGAVNVTKDVTGGKIDIEVVGGSSALFPNGIELVTSSRDFQSSDIGKILVVTTSNVHLTMPLGTTFGIGTIFGLKFLGNLTDCDFESTNGAVVEPLITVEDGEFITFSTGFSGSNSSVGVISGQYILDNGIWKTDLKYLYDKVNALGGDFITKTKVEIDALISTNALVKGATYKITGVHPTLYNDGTNSGTTILLKAISENVLETQGTGIFYNPKYNQAVDGFGIWENKMYGTFSSISGTLDYQNKETVTADNGATGILLADGMIQFVSGNWSLATSITGGTSGATANVVDFVSPSYAINDKVIWGGYSWTNVNGNIGASTDVLNLNAEWSKNVYDTTNYNIAYDVIEYDYTNDMIIRRHEIESNVDIRCSKVQFDYLVGSYGLNYNPISVQQFGNAFNISTIKGQLNINVNGGYDESINFSGSYQNNLTFGQGASQFNLTFGQGAIQFNLTFGEDAYQNNLTFGQNAYQNNLTFGQDAFQSNLTFGQNAYQNNLTFGQDAYQSYLTFGQDANQNGLTFGQEAYQSYLTFGQNANQNNLTFGQSSYQSNLTFNDNIIQRNIEFDINTQLDYSSQTLSTSIINARFRTNGGAVTIPNISTATYIYDNTLLKDIYTRPDGTIKLKFMNDLDVLEVHGIAD